MFLIKGQYGACLLETFFLRRETARRGVSTLSAINRGLRRSSPQHLVRGSVRRSREREEDANSEHGEIGSHRNAISPSRWQNAVLEETRAYPYEDSRLSSDELKAKHKEERRRLKAKSKAAKEEREPEEAVANVSIRHQALQAEAERLGEVKYSNNKLKNIIRDLNKLVQGLRKSKKPRKDMVDAAEVAVSALNGATEYWASTGQNQNGTRYLYDNIVRPRMRKTICAGWPTSKTDNEAWVVVPDLEKDEGFALYIPGRLTNGRVSAELTRAVGQKSDAALDSERPLSTTLSHIERPKIERRNERILARKAIDQYPPGETKHARHIYSRNDERSRSELRRAQSSAPGIANGDGNLDHPVAVPFASAASIFLYGYNTVVAALKARRRKLYQLHLHPRVLSRDGVDNKYLLSLASAAGVQIHENQKLELMNKMSGERPHNGVVLEASRLPAPPVLALGRPDLMKGTISLSLDRQSAEDFQVNGGPETLPFNTRAWRQPFVVMLDGITDPANVGSIVRSAHFYGVDAIAIATNTCANLASSTLAKASSGACEAMKIFAISRPSNFVYESAKLGWRIYAAVAPRAETSNPVTSVQPFRDPGRNTTTAQVSQSSPLARHPVILLLGAEGEGLRDNLRKRADVFVSISRGGHATDSLDVGVDSVNVGVAAGVLMEAFLRNPTNTNETESKDDDNRQTL